MVHDTGGPIAFGCSGRNMLGHEEERNCSDVVHAPRSSDTVEAIRALSTKFRQAIEISCSSLVAMSPVFSTFPEGACGDTSLLLFRRLRDNGHDGFDYVLLTRNEGRHTQSHAWLQDKHDLVVDITGDQFASASELSDITSVFVGLISEHLLSEYFEEQERFQADFEDYDCRTRQCFRRMYETLKAAITGWEPRSAN